MQRSLSLSRAKGSVRLDRAGIITILTIALIVLLILWWHSLFGTDRSMEKFDLNSEAARLASNLFFAKMTAIAQITVALIAAAWALVTLRDVSVHVEGASSKICFWLANISFGFSLLAYAIGNDFIIERVFHHATFDIDAEYIKAIKNSQQNLFLNGLLDFAVSIFYGMRKS
jgi:hypothetical protein